MNEQGRFMLWPRATDVTLVWAVVLFLGLLVLAFLIEILRRRRDRRLRLLAEWEAVRKIADQKELTQQEWSLLEKMLHHQAAQSPLRP